MSILNPEFRSHVRLNVGCGSDYRDGYLNIDVDQSSRADFFVVNHDLSALPQQHYEEILAWDVLEHIPHAYTVEALLNWAGLLKIGGKLVLQTSYLPGVISQMEDKPSFETEYNWMRCLFGNQAHPGDFHHICFTKSTMRAYLIASGFSVSEFNFVDRWLIQCEATKSVDYHDIVSLDLDAETFARRAYDKILCRPIEESVVSEVARECHNEKGKISLVRRLLSAPENLYRIGANLNELDRG